MPRFRALPLTLLLLAACAEATKPPTPAEHIPTPTPPPEQLDSAMLADRLSKPPAATEQISQYIRRIFQDRDGNMWFGTTTDGVARYDGRSLNYFTPANGFGSDWVSGMAQDAQGDIWFTTRDGVSRYNPSAMRTAGSTQFTNYTEKDGLVIGQVWSLLLDKSGEFWFGGDEGVSRFDGKQFTAFPIPAADLSRFPYYRNPKQISCIVQDKTGNIWFGSNGGGVYKFDGKTLINVSEVDGLCNNFVTTIMEDLQGKLWFGTRYGGLCMYDPSVERGPGSKPFTVIDPKDLNGDEIWTLYQASNGIIWIAVARRGLCSYDPSRALAADRKHVTCYNEKDGTGIRVVQSILEDANGQLWFGTSGGVYKFNGAQFTNWTKKEALGG
jgi:ligand-binding sensor domain-containing protein